MPSTAAPARDYAEEYLDARRAVHAAASFVQRLAAVNAAQDVDDAARAVGVLLYLPALDEQARAEVLPAEPVRTVLSPPCAGAPDLCGARAGEPCAPGCPSLAAEVSA